MESEFRSIGSVYQLKLFKKCSFFKLAPLISGFDQKTGVISIVCLEFKGGGLLTSDQKTLFWMQ
jgi:hypothetical protein